MKTRPWNYPGDELYKDAITQRRDQELQHAHRKRIKESHGTVDCDPPSTFGVGNLSHLLLAKKRHLRQNQQLQIFSENTRLVEKMMQINNRSLNNGSSLNNKHPLRKGEACYGKRSLNQSARKKEHERIAKGNKLLKQRENALKSEYSRTEMVKFGREKQKYANIVSKSHRYIARVDEAKEARMAAEKRKMNGTQIHVPRNMILSTSNGNRMTTITQTDGKAVSLKTARQVRNDVALHRGQPLPHILR